MSDCGVCLYYSDDFDGYIDEAKIVTTDKERRCCECGVKVAAGSLIEEAVWMDPSEYEDGDLDEEGEPIACEAKKSLYTCLICAEIANAFSCDGRVYGGNLWDALSEVMDELSTSCFNRLKTPEAKAELQRRWMAWKGIAA